MTSSAGQDAWSFDQITKSEFFHQKLHEWGVLEVARQIEQVRGETLNWSHDDLGISEAAWNKVIHQGIKPIVIFAHPQVLMSVSRSAGYYRMLAMVSQKSMKRVSLDDDRYEQGKAFPDEPTANAMAQHLNRLISRLIEADQQVDAREFDLWRGMAAGAQAQGSWQNNKGNIVEERIKSIVKHGLVDNDHVLEAAETRWRLKDGRTVVFANEPDIAFYDNDQILAAVEIKGGIDKAGVLERIGAALKSLSRAKRDNPEALTILILQGVSLTQQAMTDLENNRDTVDYPFTVEEVMNDESRKAHLFALLGI